MNKIKLKVPPAYRPRLQTVAAKQAGAPSLEAFALHLIDRGLRVYEGAASPSAGSAAVADAGGAAAALGDRLIAVADEQGYSGLDELVEHLLERGLRAYEEPASDPEKLAARLRGLGYID